MAKGARPASTMERVAELAGVSRSTVSRVVNNDPNVKVATRRRILDIVEREGYVPNRSARGLASGRTGMIGVVISYDLAHLFSDLFFSELFKAVYGASRDHDLVVSLWLMEGRGHGNTIEQITRGSSLDGAIVAASTVNDPIVAALGESKKPFVVIGRPADDPTLSYVDVANRSAERNATAHLLRSGRRRIALLAGPAASVAAIDRKAGYLDALTAAGIPADLDLVYDADFSAADATIGTRRLMQQLPDAIVAANDTMAIAAMAELAVMGVRVPEDVAVVGFDDVAAARHATPPLTTVRQSIPDLATEAVAALARLISDPSLPPQQVLVPTELIIRASCGARSLQGDPSNPTTPTHEKNTNNNVPEKEIRK